MNLLSGSRGEKRTEREAQEGFSPFKYALDIIGITFTRHLAGCSSVSP